MISTVFHSVEFNGDTLVYFSRKIDTWKQRFPFNRFAHRRRRKKPPVILITHTHEWKSTKFTCWQNHTETNNSLGSWLSFFFGENKTLDREKKVTSHVDDSLTTTTFKNQKICNGRMTNVHNRSVDQINGDWENSWADRFLPPPHPLEPETKWWPGYKISDRLTAAARAFILTLEMYVEKICLK